MPRVGPLYIPDIPSYPSSSSSQHDRSNRHVPYCDECWSKDVVEILPEEDPNRISNYNYSDIASFKCNECGSITRWKNQDIITKEEEQPPYQPATPQQPAPREGQPNYPNIEKFNEEEVECFYCGKSFPEDKISEHENYCSDDTASLEKFNEEEEEKDICVACGHSLVEHEEGGCEHENCECKDYTWRKEEPDPSNPDRELDKDPDIPEPVDEDEENERKPFEGQPVTTEGLEVPDKIEIPERLYNDLMMMIEYSVSNDNEAGGFLIIAEHGNLGVVGEQFGKNREIVLEPNEELHKGEMLIGTVHMHPVTPTASTGDVKGYLNDENEKVMVVVGADKSINIFFKTPFTAEGDYGDEISDNFEQSDMDVLCEGFGFLWYRSEESDRTVASILTNVIDNVELDIVDETWPIEQLVKGLGIKGRPDIPTDYSTKKQPLRLQIPFHYNCNERRLVG